MKFEINSDDFEQKKLDQEALHKELDLIQECLGRMAQNLFLFKGWFITLTSGLIALSISSQKPLWVLGLGLALLTISMWLQHTFFLWNEHAFRKLYQVVLDKRKKNDFSNQYELDPVPYRSNFIRKALFSKPSRVLFLPVFLISLGFVAVKILRVCGCV